MAAAVIFLIVHTFAVLRWDTRALLILLLMMLCSLCYKKAGTARGAGPTRPDACSGGVVPKLHVVCGTLNQQHCISVRGVHPGVSAIPYHAACAQTA